jgi:gas vesicle protein
MKIERLYRKASMLTPVLAGGTVGAGLGLLFAPQSGYETREDIKKIANRVTHAVDVGKDLYGEGRVFVNKAVEATRKAFVEEKPLAPIVNGKNALLVPVVIAGSIGIIGAGIALLLAPKKGIDIRRDLKEFASTSRDTVASAIDKGRDFYVAGKDAVYGAAKAGRKAFSR